MTAPKHIIIALASSLLISFSSLSAQASASTDPVGFKTLTVKGNNGITLLGIEFLGESKFTGQVNEVTSNSVLVDGINFDELLDSASSYFLEIVSDGDNDGINTLITGWFGSTINLGDDLTGLIDIGSDTIRIFRLPTISEVFDGVLSGGSATTADLIYMPNPDGSGLTGIYYSTGGFFGVGWRQIGAGSTDKSDLPIYFSDGLYILKRSAGDTRITTSGVVKLNSHQVVVDEGFTTFSTIFPVGTTLSNSGFYDSSSPSKSISAGSATTADLVYTDSDGDGSLEGYYYSSGGFFGVGWRQIGAGSLDKSDIPLGSGFGILRRTSPTMISRSAPY